MNIEVVHKWFKWGLVNLAIVALYGALMRYKIAFNFPFFEQKNLLHAHSHFAFSGWISQLLYSGFLLLLFPYISQSRQRKYNLLLVLNLITSFGMLAAFTIQGYKTVSILFSTLSIVVAVWFAIVFIKDQKRLPAAHPSKPWAIAALLLNILSSAGPLSLAYMMATKNITSSFYLGSVYYYLHFQYNGWFFFGTIAIIAAYLPAQAPSLKKYFKLFAVTIIPTFFLSILWAKLPTWLYSITVIAALLQLSTWVLLAKEFWKYFKQNHYNVSPLWVNYFFYIAALSVTLKFVLQAISIIPSLSQLVFGFRPIVIAYIHLVLLGVFSLFFIGFMFAKRIIAVSKGSKIAAFGFLIGVLLNESFLGIQGFASFAYIPVPHINELLLVAAILLFASAVCLNIFQIPRLSNRQKKQ